MTIKISERMWGKKALHLPNLRDVLGCDTVDIFFWNYQTRILSLLGREHKIFLSLSQKDKAIELIKYYNKIGFNNLSENSLIFLEDSNYDNSTPISTLALSYADKIKELRDSEFESIVPFTSSEKAQVLALKYEKGLDLSQPLSHLLNDKCHLRDMLSHEGIRVPGSNRISIHQKNYKKKCIEIYNKLSKETGIEEFAIILPYSASGYGILRFKNDSQLKTLLKNLPKVDYFLLDPWYTDNIGSPAFQIYMGDNEEQDINLGLSDQILDGTLHNGNSYPSIYKHEPAVIDIVERMKTFLRKKGVRGIVGVDLLIRRVNGKIVPYVLEVNARQTGAVYAGLLAYEIRNGQDKPWLGHNLVEVPENITVKDFHKYLKDCGVDYKKDDNEGIIIISNGNVSYGKMMIVIIADTKERIQEMLEIAQNYKKV